MQQRFLGNSGISVSSIGLGCMGMSWAYAENSRDDDASIAVIRQAIESGITLIDTADIYGDGHNESLVGRALTGVTHETTLATKAGLVVDDLATKKMHRDASPQHLRSALEASLRRLNRDSVDLYYLHRVDENIPLEESWETMSNFVAEGKVRYLGLSEVTASQAATAHAIHPVTAIQSEMSLWTRDPLLAEPPAHAPGVQGQSISSWAAENGASLVPFAPLGRGFLTGEITASTTFEATDLRSVNPRFTPDALAQNQHIADAVREVAQRLGATPAQVAIAWTLAQGEHVIPIPGTRQSAHLASNIGATELVLSSADLAELTTIPTPVGSRY